MVKKAILNELIKKQDLNSLEQHLIFSYLTNNKLDFTKSPILTDYFKGFEQDMKLYFDTSPLEIGTIKDLENHLELIIPQRDRKLNGAFFTPDYIVDFIINELKPESNHKNLDPSCGCGAFLIGLTEYYKNTFGKPIQSIIKENIYGSDILEYNIHRTKLILTVYALQNGEILDDSDFNLYHQDSLKANWRLQFDNIVGNPPYVKFQDLTDENREYLVNNWTTIEGGTFNLYFAFFELGYNLLTQTGKLGYITPNNYFTSLAGEAIRRYFQQKKCVSRIIDFTHKKVFDAQTYTALTFLNKQKNEAISFDRLKEGYNPKDFLEIANGSLNYLNELNPKKWRLLKTDEQINIRTIETIGTPISKLFDICVGIATLKDDVFFIDGRDFKNGYFLKNTEKGNFEIEKEVTKPVYKISDFSNQEEVEKNTRRIICPYNIKKGVATPISETEFKKKFPKCYAYFLAEKEALSNRDKGKVKFEPFFVWGRTQGLTKKGKKILNPTFSREPRFLLIKEEDSFFTNGYGTYFREQESKNSLFGDTSNPISRIENIDVVQKILNSCLMHYYVSKTSVSIEGGFPCYQKNFIEKFSIPHFSISEMDTLRSLKEIDEIDDFLINKYQVNILRPNLCS
ncbi:Eco57I restriction-modification methylase domain-containing protein [Cognataquiflexum aquatile]|uniref:Eco57I restriction-modification methylase domain-containing protein n=1 Tax=Cognataquiflexum aquatile TaxID=2249427 RepID=UPI000DEA900D|nr:N-6 DNA methylase [Cognataquiflexum aquatile]